MQAIEGERDVLLSRDRSDVMCDPILTTNVEARGTYWHNLTAEETAGRLGLVFAAMRL